MTKSFVFSIRRGQVICGNFVSVCLNLDFPPIKLSKTHEDQGENSVGHIMLDLF